MKKYIGFILFFVLFFPYITSAVESDTYAQLFEDKYKEQTDIGNELSKIGDEYIASHDRKLLPIMYEKAIKIHNIPVLVANTNIISMLEVTGDSYSAAIGRNTLEALAKSACIHLLFTAKIFAYAGTKKDLDTAKELYRLIITSYTGSAYTSFVKEAEFGLEDLREKKPKNSAPTRQQDSDSLSKCKDGNFLEFQKIVKRAGFLFTKNINSFEWYQRDYPKAAIGMRNCNGNCCEGFAIINKENATQSEEDIVKEMIKDLIVIYFPIQHTLSGTSFTALSQVNIREESERVVILTNQIMANLSRVNHTEFLFDNLNVRAECYPVSSQDLQAGKTPPITVKLWIP